MPLYFFRIRNGQYSGASEYGTECADRDAAWRELTTVCADMASGISRKLAENSEWHLELLDESKQPVFRIRIVAETLDRTAGRCGGFCGAPEAGGETSPPRKF